MKSDDSSVYIAPVSETYYIIFRVSIILDDAATTCISWRQSIYSWFTEEH